MTFKKWIISLFVTLITALSLNAVKHKTYDDVVSLGQSCQVTWQLETNGFRKLAYPFDWFITPYDSLVRFISYEGAGFFEADKIRSYGILPVDSEHLHVVDLLYGINSYHDFLSLPPFSNYEEIKLKYDRRISRFFNLLNSRKRILLVRQGLTKIQVEHLNQLLHSLYPKLKYTILAVSDLEEFRHPWKMKRIQNFYLQEEPGNWKGDFVRWAEILSHYSIKHTEEPRLIEEIW